MAQPDKGWDYNPSDRLAGVKQAIDNKRAKSSSVLMDALDAKLQDMSISSFYSIHRTSWDEGFPDVDIYAKERVVKDNQFYDAAKSGDIYSAIELIKQTISHSKMKSLNKYRDKNPILVAIHGIEAVSDNVIPVVLAEYVAKQMRFDVENNIVQTTKAAHTGADGWWRLLSQADFSGDVAAGRNYIMIDDFIGMGGTFANLRGYIEANGGSVIKAISLTGKPRSLKLALSEKTLNMIRSKYGSELESWWESIFGYRLSELTESEANYLIRAGSFDTIRNKIIAAAQKRN